MASGGLVMGANTRTVVICFVSLFIVYIALAIGVAKVFIGLVVLLILYMVIETAVRQGINNSVIGKFYVEKYGLKVSQKSIFDNDLNEDIES